MARPKKNEAPDLTQAIELTAGAIERLTCPTGKQQVFMRDSKAPGLRVRATPASAKHPTGFKSFVFEKKLDRQTIRRTIGGVTGWSIDAARIEAARLTVMFNAGTDPRELERQQQADKTAKAAADAAQAVTVGDLWPRYLTEGKPKRKDAWKPGYRADIEAMAGAGGVPKKRGQGLTRPGPMFPLMALALGDVTEDALQLWFEREAVASKHQAARALMMFRGFLRWCAARPEYRKLINRDAGRAPAILENLPANTKRTDALEAAQVAGWWSAVEQLGNRSASAYLRALLLTGARREEMAALKWADVDFVWGKLTIADKVDATRTLPLTDYLAQIFSTLPRVGEYVFASGSKSGRLTDTRASHAKALKSAGIASLTIHGLRRSFSLLGEAAGAPAGAIAQVMGHKPSATAEGYRPRTVDALRPYLKQIEDHILKMAGVEFDRATAKSGLRLVSAEL